MPTEAAGDGTTASPAIHCSCTHHASQHNMTTKRCNVAGCPCQIKINASGDEP